MGNDLVKKKGSKKGLIAISIVAVLLAIVMLYGFVITRSGYWLLSKFTPDSEHKVLSYTSASDTTQIIADEGFVLMQNNDNLLPLKATADAKMNINVFGMRGVQLVYNAGGSAASNVERCIKLEDALNGTNGNFNVNEDLLHLYYNYYKKGNISIAKTEAPINKSASEFIEEPSNITVPEVPSKAYNDTTLYSDGKTIMEHAYEFSDTALIVIGRGGGEVYDFTVETLQLSDDESNLVKEVTAKFDKVILVVNSANTMELDFVKDYPQIKSVVWIGYPGESGIESFVKILNGTINPSGRTADTWLADNTANPSFKNYLEMNEDGTWNKNSFKYTNTPEELGYFTNYSEGVFVGYKYYESRFDTDSTYKYDEAVMYPFGYGLSYTTFEKNMMALDESNGVLTVRVSVKNAGTVAGKDVIQIYYNPPYTGAIQKSTVNLVAYKKTNMIAPGDTEYYSITFPIEEMASYDAETNKAFVLEKGDYGIMLKENAHVLIDSQNFKLSKDIIYNEANDGKRASDMVEATNRFDDAYGVGDYLTREWDQNNRVFTGAKPEDFVAPPEVLEAMKPFVAPTDAELGLSEKDMPLFAQKLVSPIMFSEMVGVEFDDPKWDEFISQLTLEEMATLNGNGAWQINGIDRLGMPRTLTPDGSTGIGASIYSGAIMGTDGKGVTYPTSVVLASTWNEEIAKMMGTSVGNEAQALGYSGWYAPAQNIHKTPFNGRNFEYFSEDSVLSGNTAGSVIQGATEKGVIVFIKHFALNERESNDRSQAFSWASEQAMREVFLKTFEISVKKGGAMGAMSSFNYIGLNWAGGSNALLNEVLRDEWGFKGLVITDANLYPHMNIVEMTYGGGDLSLDVMSAWKGGEGQSVELLAKAKDEAYKIAMTKNLQASSKNIAYAVSRSWKATNK